MNSLKQIASLELQIDRNGTVKALARSPSLAGSREVGAPVAGFALEQSCAGSLKKYKVAVPGPESMCTRMERVAGREFVPARGNRPEQES